MCSSSDILSFSAALSDCSSDAAAVAAFFFIVCPSANKYSSSALSYR